MPLDPNIANPKQFQMPDPMEGMGQALTNAMLIDKLRTSQDERYNNAMLGQAWKEGGGDRAKVTKALIERGQGANVPVLMKQFAEIDDKIAGAAKTESETIKTELDNFKSVVAQLAGTPNVTAEQMYNVLGAGFNNPVIGQWYARMKITPELMKQGIDHAAQSGRVSDVAKFLMLGDKALEQQYHVIQEKDKQTLVGSNKYGTPNAAVAGTYGAKPNEGTTVNVNTGEKAISEFDKAVGKARGERFIELENAAQAAPAMIAEVDRALGILNSGKVILGAGSQTLLDIARVAKAMGMPIENESMVNTEELSRFFAQNTLSNIARFKQMGVALTPMSDSDRRLVEMASAQGTNDPATIRRLLLLQRQMAQQSIVKYNEMAQRYSSNPATAPGQQALSTQPMTVPGTPNPAPGVKRTPNARAIEYLKKNPGTAAQFDEAHGQPGLAQQILRGGGGGSFNPPSEGTGGTARWAPQIQQAATQYGVPIEVVQEVMRHESGGNAKALSPMGAIGLMQLMPGTAKSLGVNPHDPNQNILGGVKYLRQLYDQTGSWTQAIAAYNGGLGSTGYSKDKGMGHLRKWENPNNQGWAETRRYVKNIKGALKNRGVEISAAPANAFVG